MARTMRPKGWTWRPVREGMSGPLDLMGHDQFGNVWGPLDPRAPKKSLLEKTGRSTAEPMYIDKVDGRVVKIGYVVRPPKPTKRDPYRESELWVTLYWEDNQPWEKPA